MNLNEKLDKELERRFEDLEGLETGSREQSEATDNIVKLYKLRQDEKEQEVSAAADADKYALERHKLELEEQKANDSKLVSILGTATSVVLTFAGFAVGSYWYGKGFKFEETGTFCSKTAMGIMRDFKFFKK